MHGLPSAIQVGPIRYRVSATEEDAKRYLYEGSTLQYSGRSVHTDQLIVLGTTEGLDRCADTLLHEVLHALSSVFHLELKEGLVANMSAPLLDMLRRNPELVKYLTDGSE